MRADIVPGAALPDFELPDQTGVLRRLSELQGNNPMCLMLARGSYCPKDNRQHIWMAAMEPEIKVSYSRVVTISTDDRWGCLEWQSILSVNWPFLSDTQRLIQKELDIQEYTDPHHNPMIPHTLMLEPGLVIHSIYNGYWYWGRPTPDEVRRDFRAISRKIRPDWDLAAPGLREEWEAGERGRFWPYQGRG